MKKIFISLAAFLSSFVFAKPDTLVCRAHYTLAAEDPCLSIGPFPGPAFPVVGFQSHVASVKASDDKVTLMATASKKTLAEKPEEVTLSASRLGQSVSLGASNSNLRSPVGGRLTLNLGEEEVENFPECKFHRFLFFRCEMGE